MSTQQNKPSQSVMSPNSLLQLLLIFIFNMSLTGCAMQDLNYKPSNQEAFKLHPCKSVEDDKCVARLFAKGVNIAKRDPQDFPNHYLELYDKNLRAADCKRYGRTEQEQHDCEDRLEIVSDYFNHNDQTPGEKKIGVALEGGGTKSAHFALGTLAGLQELEMLDAQVGAISSISGGSYAASYYFNRLFDCLKCVKTSAECVKTSCKEDAWFNSCIPEYFINRNFKAIKDGPVKELNCGEMTKRSDKLSFNEFKPQYQYIGHVWKNHDILRADTPGNLSTYKDLHLREYGNLGLLIGETAVTIPFQFLARSVFRWPLNSSPSKLVYKLGLEREYGYSPQDWANAGNTDLDHMKTTLFDRREKRTLNNFKCLLENNDQVPLWIIGTTAPGSIGGTAWLSPAPRDPLRQQFELTWNGYGSGTYGYARQPPDAQFDFLGRNPEGLPILDAVVASGAFFDDNETRTSRQPFRFFAGATQHFLNITWFTEIRNFNVDQEDRQVAKVLPWPAYLEMTTRQEQTPYIHLQDGGNTENSGILPLLRRGYRTIIYEHGSQDENAEWAEICHLKNQLELDGTYSIRSQELDDLMDSNSKHENPIQSSIPGGRSFNSYLDGLCSSQLDESDLIAFDKNPNWAPEKSFPAVAMLYCGRLGYPVQPNKNNTCPEFEAKIDKDSKKSSQKAEADIFFHWPAGRFVRFEVLRKEDSDIPPKHISTIIAIVPGIDFNDLKHQLIHSPDIKEIHNWDEWCSLGSDVRSNQQIAYCSGPKDILLSSDRNKHSEAALPCSTLAYILEATCTGKTGHKRPQFPQDNFILETIHTSYTSYAAYFDLARHQVRNVVCNNKYYTGPKSEHCN